MGFRGMFGSAVCMGGGVLFCISIVLEKGGDGGGF